ncbi:TPA: hypothetical protein ACLUBU_001919, partial [Neisseria gonorrhoeae]
RAKPAIIPFEIKRYRLCAGLLIAFVYELAPAVLPIRGCLFFLVFVFFKSILILFGRCGKIRAF